MSNKTCKCGKGKASAHDGKCGHCRTKRERQALDDKFKEAERVQKMFTHPIEVNTVATTHTCELGEHCRCKPYDVAYQQDCWNWIGVVK